VRPARVPASAARWPADDTSAQRRSAATSSAVFTIRASDSSWSNGTNRSDSGASASLIAQPNDVRSTATAPRRPTSRATRATVAACSVKPCSGRSVLNPS